MSKNPVPIFTRGLPAIEIFPVWVEHTLMMVECHNDIDYIVKFVVLFIQVKVIKTQQVYFTLFMIRALFWNYALLLLIYVRAKVASLDFTAFFMLNSLNFEYWRIFFSVYVRHRYHFCKVSLLQVAKYENVHHITKFIYIFFLGKQYELPWWLWETAFHVWGKDRSHSDSARAGGNDGFIFFSNKSPRGEHGCAIDDFENWHLVVFLRLSNAAVVTGDDFPGSRRHETIGRRQCRPCQCWGSQVERGETLNFH